MRFKGDAVVEGNEVGPWAKGSTDDMKGIITDVSVKGGLAQMAAARGSRVAWPQGQGRTISLQERQ